MDVVRSWRPSCCRPLRLQVSWFIAPTVALVEQQSEVIKSAIPVSVGMVSGASEPNQWKDAQLWRRILSSHKIMVTTPQVLLDALHHVSFYYYLVTRHFRTIWVGGLGFILHA